MLLTAEQWAARAQQSGQRSSPAQKNSGKQKPQGSGGDKDKGAANAVPQHTGNCRYCGKAGHWAKECRKAAHDHERRGEVANLVDTEEEEEEEEKPGLLMA
jgi:hypothetical protein